MRLLAAPLCAKRHRLRRPALAAQWLASTYFGVNADGVSDAGGAAPRRRVARRATRARWRRRSRLVAPLFWLRQHHRSTAQAQSEGPWRALGRRGPFGECGAVGLPRRKRGTRDVRGVLPRSHNERELFPGTATPRARARRCDSADVPRPDRPRRRNGLRLRGLLGLNGLIYDDLYGVRAAVSRHAVPPGFAALVGSGLIPLRVRRPTSVPARTDAATPGALFALLSAGALVDLRSDVELMPYLRRPTDLFEREADMVLAELPMPVASPSRACIFRRFHWRG